MKTMYAALILTIAPLAAQAEGVFHCTSKTPGDNTVLIADVSTNPAKFSVMNDADPTDFEGALEEAGGVLLSHKYVITVPGGDPKLEIVQKQKKQCGRAGCWEGDLAGIWQAKLSGSQGETWFTCE